MPNQEKQKSKDKTSDKNDQASLQSACGIKSLNEYVYGSTYLANEGHCEAKVADSRAYAGTETNKNPDY